MVLCDIGNSFYHFYRDGSVWKVPVREEPHLEDEPIHVVCVNQDALRRLRKKYTVIDISSECTLDSGYIGLGADRIFACYGVRDGIVVDAGSAITVDVMHEGIHLGGFILPGISAFYDAYSRISDRLDVRMNMGIDLNRLPQNTTDAVSFGILGAIIHSIEHAGKGKFIYFTGGDGKFLSKFFESRCVVDDLLVFKGMLKFLQKGVVC